MNMNGSNKRFTEVMQVKGMKVYAQRRREDMQEFLSLYFETEKEEKMCIIPYDKYCSNAMAAIGERCGNIVWLRTAERQKMLLRALKEKWDSITKVQVEYEKAEVVYRKLWEKARSGGISGQLFIDNGKCYMLSKAFEDVMTELGVKCEKKKFGVVLQQKGYLEYSPGRKVIKKKGGGMKVQDWCYCLLAESQNSDIVEEWDEEDDETALIADGKHITAFPYMGGKNGKKMNESLQSLLPEQIEDYVEPFAGSASVALNNFDIKGEVVLNDKDPAVANLLHTLSEKEDTEQLLKVLEKSNFGAEEFVEAKRIHEAGNKMDSVKRAWSELILIYCSFDCLRRDYRKLEAVDREKLKARAIQNVRSTSVKLRMNKCRVTNRDALEVLREYKDRDAFLYIDPPYVLDLVSSKQLYREVLDEEKQREMLGIIQTSKARILVSGYGSEDESKDLYGEYLDEEHGWHRYILGEFHKASSGNGSRGVEVVWCNYEIPSKARYHISI